MSDEYTPTMNELRDEHSGARHVSIGTVSAKDAEFDRTIAAHDQALHEQIAQKIEAEMRRHDNAQIGFSAVGDAYAHAARIARGEAN